MEWYRSSDGKEFVAYQKRIKEERKRLAAEGYIVCSECGEKKPVNEFPKNQERSIGYAYICSECGKNYNTNWKSENPQYSKAWNAAHPGYRTEYRHRNLEKAREQERRANSLRRARSYGVEHENWTTDEVIASFGRDCGLCGERVQYDQMSVDHIFPLSLGGADSMRNLQIVHLGGNRRKQTKTMDEYYEYLELIGFTPKEGCGIFD